MALLLRPKFLFVYKTRRGRAQKWIGEKRREAKRREEGKREEEGKGREEEEKRRRKEEQKGMELWL